MKKYKVKRLFAVLVSVVMVLSSLVFVPVVVGAEDQLNSGRLRSPRINLGVHSVGEIVEVDGFEFEVVDEINMVIGEATPASPFYIEEANMTGFKSAFITMWFPASLPNQCPWGCPVLNHVEATPIGTYLGWWSCTWYSNGYRVFRSLAPVGEGLSITDFPIMAGTRFAFDANATALPGFSPGMPIYYRIEAVLEEARLEFDENGDPVLIPEVLTNNFNWVRTYVICNGCCLIEPRTRGSVIMQIGSNDMQVDDAGVRGYASPRSVGIDAPPFIDTGRTMLPVRAMLDGIGAEIDWDDADRRIDLTALGLNGQTNNASMWIGRVDALVNNQNLMMDVAPIISGGRTFIPVRYAAEFLGSEIAWIASQNKVVIVFLLPTA